MSEPIFTDIDFGFARHPISNDITRKSDVEAIKILLKNLIRTSFYERLFNSSIGSSVDRLLFEPMSPIVSVMMKRAIEQTITNFEPRVALQNVIVTTQYDNNSFSVDIEYTILGTQSMQSFSMILERSR
jgi:phage baseplate assembly protein W